MAPASLTPVAVVMTLTPPDCVAPPTVIEDLVIVSERVGSVDACAEPTANKPPAKARSTLTARPARTGRL